MPMYAYVCLCMPVVGVGFIFQLFMEFGRENFRTAPAA
jgi:hypothetical protein